MGKITKISVFPIETVNPVAEFEGEQLDRERNGRRNGPTAAAGEMVRLRFAWAVAVRSSQLDI